VYRLGPSRSVHRPNHRYRTAPRDELIVTLGMNDVETRKVLPRNLKRKKQRVYTSPSPISMGGNDTDTVARVLGRRVLTEDRNGVSTLFQRVAEPVSKMAHTAARPARQESLDHRDPKGSQLKYSFGFVWHALSMRRA
jgi:hypothetical protein